MQMQSNPGLDTHGRIWENEPRGGWDAFQAAKRRHLKRLAVGSGEFRDDAARHAVDWASLEPFDSKRESRDEELPAADHLGE